MDEFWKRDFYQIEASLRKEVKEKIVLAMWRAVDYFKDYVSSEDEHDNYPKEVSGRTNYGCEKDNYYYCFLPGFVQFIYENSYLRSDLIFFDDKIKCWFVYDGDKKEYVTFAALDTDSQIAFYTMLDRLLYTTLPIYL
jgi:hypothetical protein